MKVPRVSSLSLLAAHALLLFSGSAWAQHEQAFAFRGANGSNPSGGVVVDASGNFYGITYLGGASGKGVVFEISPTSNGRAVETVLYSFTGLNGDGSNPMGDLVFDNMGNLYGVTQNGGALGFGTVFELSAPASPGGEWTERVLYSFQGTPSDGAEPVSGLVFDDLGNLYGTTSLGGVNNADCDANPGCGTVFELSPPPAPGGSWTESVLYFFQGFQDGEVPLAGMIFDPAGNLYGTTSFGGYNGGVVFDLAPPSQEGGVWSETVLHRFQGLEGARPQAGLTLGANGALFGTASEGGQHGAGTVFRLRPPLTEGGNWLFGVVHSFDGLDGAAPLGSLTVSPPNTLYGTTSSGEGVLGEVFQSQNLTISSPFSILYQLDSGSRPSSRVTVNNGALYSTTSGGGYKNDGTVFQLTP